MSIHFQTASICKEVNAWRKLLFWKLAAWKPPSWLRISPLTPPPLGRPVPTWPESPDHQRRTQICHKSVNPLKLRTFNRSIWLSRGLRYFLKQCCLWFLTFDFFFRGSHGWRENIDLFCSPTLTFPHCSIADNNLPCAPRIFLVKQKTSNKRKDFSCYLRGKETSHATMRDPYWDGILSFAHKSHATSMKPTKITFTYIY